MNSIHPLGRKGGKVRESLIPVRVGDKVKVHGARSTRFGEVIGTRPDRKILLSERMEYMVSLLPGGVKTVLEPTPGVGNIVRELTKKGYSVTAPDDFFHEKLSRHDAVVMNPPFSAKFCFNLPEHFQHQGMRLGYHMMLECMKASDIVIALMPWFTISDSDKRLRQVQQFGLKSITALPRKTFAYARIQTVVLHMEKGFSGITEFKTFNF